MKHNSIWKILRWRREANSETEKHFIKHHLGPYGFRTDNFGNLHKRIGKAPVMWSAHVDTVHNKEGWQRIQVDEAGVISLRPNKSGKIKSNCLGADDGAGMWLLLEMIEQGIEGLYVFHREEEKGGKGSDYITTYQPSLVRDIKFAIAFDRNGTKDIITQQRGRSCSDEFGEGLAKALGMGHEISDKGRFTDTANYRKLIPECTNISVGYSKEHSQLETLDLRYLAKLRDAVFALDIGALEVFRKTSDPLYDAYDYSGRSGVNNYKPYETGSWANHYNASLPVRVSTTTVENMCRLIQTYPRQIARMYMDLGYTYNEFREQIMKVDMTKKNVWCKEEGSNILTALQAQIMCPLNDGHGDSGGFPLD